MRKKDILESLPLEVGKNYKTSFASGEGFLLTRIEKRKEPVNQKLSFSEWLQKFKPNVGIVQVYGVYDKAPHLGECSLSMSIVRPEQRKTGEIDVCSKCGHPTKEE